MCTFQNLLYFRFYVLIIVSGRDFISFWTLSYLVAACGMHVHTEAGHASPIVTLFFCFLFTLKGCVHLSKYIRFSIFCSTIFLNFIKSANGIVGMNITLSGILHLQLRILYQNSTIFQAHDVILDQASCQNEMIVPPFFDHQRRNGPDLFLFSSGLYTILMVLLSVLMIFPSVICFFLREYFFS